MRIIGTIPTTADWQFHKIKPNFLVISKTHNIKWADLPYKFLEFYSGNTEWFDAVSYTHLDVYKRQVEIDLPSWTRLSSHFAG